MTPNVAQRGAQKAHRRRPEGARLVERVELLAAAACAVVVLHILLGTLHLAAGEHTDFQQRSLASSIRAMPYNQCDAFSDWRAHRVAATQGPRRIDTGDKQVI